MKLEVGERRLMIGVYWSHAGPVEVIWAEGLEARDLFAIAENVTSALAERTLEALVELHGLEDERERRAGWQERAERAEDRLQRLERERVEDIHVTRKVADLQAELERARADVSRLTARLAEGAMAVDAVGSRS